MRHYLDFLALEQDFVAITDADKLFNKDAVSDLISKIEPATDYLNTVSEEHGVKNIVAPCSIADIYDWDNVPLLIEYVNIKLEAMKSAFYALACGIDDFNLPDALGEIETITQSFTEA